MNDEVLKIIYEKNDIDYLKLFLYLYENHIEKIDKDNINKIIEETKLDIDKFNLIIKFYKDKNILPKSFATYFTIKNNEINSTKTIIYLSNYCKEKFKTDIDYQYFFKNKLYEYNYDIEIYKYIIEYCSTNEKFQNINFINWILKDISNKYIKNIEELKSYILSNPLYNKNITINKKLNIKNKINREEYNALFIKNVLKLQNDKLIRR